MKTCPKCQANVWSPFSPSRVVHDVGKCDAGGALNRLHWVLDVQMGADDSRARTGYAAENLATLRDCTILEAWQKSSCSSDFI